MFIVYSTFPDKKEVQKIARSLLEKKLAACVVFWPVNSLYWWKGKITKAGEYVIFAKTTKRNEKKARELIQKTHGYKIPCIAAIDADKINKEYEGWMRSLLG